jgi:hypothetical protein
MPLEMVIGLVFNDEIEVSVSADTLSLLVEDTLLLTEDGLTSSISVGESMDKVLVSDNEVDVVALLVEDTLLLTEDGLTSSISVGESMDKVVPDNEVEVVAMFVGDTLPSTMVGLRSSISVGESMDKVVPDNEVEVVAMFVEDTLLPTEDGLCSSSTSLDDALLLTNAGIFETKLLLRRPYAFTVLFLSGGCSEVLISSVK